METRPWNRDCKWFYVCPMKRYFEGEKLDNKLFDSYCRGEWANCMRYEMEEKAGVKIRDSLIRKALIDKIN